MLYALPFFTAFMSAFQKVFYYVFIWISITMLLTDRAKFYRPLKSSETTDRNNLGQFFSMLISTQETLMIFSQIFTKTI